MGRPGKEEDPDKGDTSQDALILRTGKWEVRVDARNHTVGFREDPKQRYLYQMRFHPSLAMALRDLSRRILTDKFIRNNLPETERTLVKAIEMIEAHDKWFKELTKGY